MSTLRKPKDPCKCGSTNNHKEKKPERWICDDCSNILSLRPMRNDPNKCRECGAKRSDKEFAQRKNICKDCMREYNRDYRDDNQDKLKDQHAKWRKDNHDHYRASIREACQKDMESWLRSRMASIKRVKISMIKGPMRSRNPARLDIQIDLDYLMQLYKDQDGKCVISGLELTHKMDCLFSASVDRKDGSVGYVPGNVQLVCKAVNMAKGNSSDSSITSFLDAYFQKRYSDVLYSESPDQ